MSAEQAPGPVRLHVLLHGWGSTPENFAAIAPKVGLDLTRAAGTRVLLWRDAVTPTSLWRATERRSSDCVTPAPRSPTANTTVAAA